MKLSRRIIASALTFAVSIGAQAADWYMTNFQYLGGNGHRVPIANNLPGDHRNVLTFEHANGWKYGDNFIWYDITNPNRKGPNGLGTDVYTEISPRLSFSKISGKKIGMGPLTDVLAAFTLEAGDRSTSRGYLWGIGTDWSVPYFKIFQANLYARKLADIDGTGTQLTVVWLAPFTLGPVKFEFSGFFDWIPSNFGDVNTTGEKFKYFHTSPQLLVDLGHFLKKPDTLFVGVEYDYWNNKFGIQDTDAFRTDQSVLQWMIKWYV